MNRKDCRLQNDSPSRPPPETKAGGSAAPLLEIRALRVWYPVLGGILGRRTGWVRAVDGVDLDIFRGEAVGLVGESGCGKTTLARAVLRLEPVHSGALRFEENDVPRLRGEALRAYRRKVQVVFQDPFASLNPRHTVLEALTEGMRVHGLVRPKDAPDAAAELLADVGLSVDLLPRFPHAFSGGQRQRIAIARALSLRPRLLICDEAVSALDVSIQAQILNLLADIRTRYGLAFLFISHDLNVVRHLADRIAVMYAGKIVETGPTETVVGAPAHPYTAALLKAVPEIGRPLEEQEVPQEEPLRPSENRKTGPTGRATGCAFAPRCPRVLDRCRKQVPVLEPPDTSRPEHRRACFLESPPGE